MWSSSTAPSHISIEELESVEFISASKLAAESNAAAAAASNDESNTESNNSNNNYDSIYPFAGMLRNSARYIADHSKRTAVFNIPGDILDSRSVFNDLMGDIALSWMLGLKIVLVVGCRFDVDCCELGFDHAHECHNSLRQLDDALLRKVEEEAGFVRFEVERTLNRHLRLHGGMSMSSTCTMRDDAPALNGNVVGGSNFYTARPFGVVDDTNYQNTGYPTKVSTQRIEQSLENNDIVLLSTVGMSRQGNAVHVNGQHLAATVAASLQANKLVFLSQNDAVMRKAGVTDKTMQEVPLQFTKALLHHHHVRVNPAGLASYDQSKDLANAQPEAMELLLHMAWSSWALEQGVNRAHMVNPYSDGSLLEELFSSKEGLNTCLYHEDESEDLELDEEQDEYATNVEFLENS